MPANLTPEYTPAGKSGGDGHRVGRNHPLADGDVTERQT